MKIGCLGGRKELLQDAIHSAGFDSQLIYDQEEVRNNYDVVLASGVYNRIPKSLLEAPKFGIIGFHESDLPFGYGCAPLPWTLIGELSLIQVRSIASGSLMKRSILGRR